MAIIFEPIFFNRGSNFFISSVFPLLDKIITISSLVISAKAPAGAWQPHCMVDRTRLSASQVMPSFWSSMAAMISAVSVLRPLRV